MGREWLKRGKARSREGNLKVERQEENGGKLQMQTQELEQARGPISRRPPNREPAQGRDGEQDWI